MCVQLMNNLDWAGATKELTAAVEYLKSTGASKVCTKPSHGSTLVHVESITDQ